MDTQDRIHVRPMTQEDIPAVAELERESFSCPWSEKLLAEGLGCQWDTYDVLEDQEGRIAGYSVIRILAGEGEVQRIAVRKDCRGRGYGRKLMEVMAGEAREASAFDITLEVRASNIPARKLYESFGFREEAVRKSYYQNPVEDAVIMWYHGTH